AAAVADGDHRQAVDPLCAAALPPVRFRQRFALKETKMVHKLAIVAIAGIPISAVCLGAGGALEGRDFSRDFPAGGGFAALFDGDRPRCETVSGGDVVTRRDLDWGGSDHVGISVPGQATY